MNRNTQTISARTCTPGKSGLLALFTLAVLLQMSPQPVGTVQMSNDLSPSTSDDDRDSDFMVIEDFDDDDYSEEQERNVFVPTKEWQVIEEGQSIPPGLHVRMNLETGLKEAKLLDDSVRGESSTLTDEHIVEDDEGKASDESAQPDRKFKGDTRRTHYYGKSDRRGIVNKKTKVFSRKELMEELNKAEENTEGQEQMLLTAQESDGGVHSTLNKASEKSSPVSIGGEASAARNSELPYTLHEDVGMMLEHSQTLAKKEATEAELVHALDELEYHVHNLDNAKDFSALGGLVLVIRQLNHSSSDVRSHAAHVIGAASQSNPTLQQQVFDYGGLEHLCSLISAVEPDLVQRRSLFALSSLLRGNVKYQLIFLERCKGLEVLGKSFRERGSQVQLKAVTLLTDIMNEQEEQVLYSKGDGNFLPVLHNHILEHGWCDHVSAPIHSEEGTRIEKGLQAMKALQSTCDFSNQIGRLKKLTKQFESIIEKDQNDSAEFTELLLDYSRTLLKTIRRQNLDL